MKKLTISIVNYNTGQYLKRCLDLIYAVRDEADINVVVVDNISHDDSIALAKKSKMPADYILNQDNVGFGRAHNQVLRDLKTEYVLILNPDVEIGPGVISHMISLMEDDPKIGASTCEVRQNGDKIDLTAHRGFPTPWASFKYYFLKDDSLYHLSTRDLKSVHEVDAISGSFFLTRKSVLEKSGVFDEDYFMYAEDIDLCFMIKKAGFKVVYDPTVFILHHKGVSSGLKKHSQEVTTANLATKQRSLDAFYSTMKIFYKKHYAKQYFFLINWLIYLGINFKWMLAKRKLTV